MHYQLNLSSSPFYTTSSKPPSFTPFSTTAAGKLDDMTLQTKFPVNPMNQDSIGEYYALSSVNKNSTLVRNDNLRSRSSSESTTLSGG